MTERARAWGWAVALVAAVTSGVACGSERVDPRFATPQKTVETLLGAYGLDGVPQEEIQRRLRARGQFDLVDAETYRACFADLDSEEAEAYAGFVVGALAAGRAQTRVTITGETAHVFPSPVVNVVMRSTGAGWKIVLRESVPADVRAQFREIARRAKKRGGS